MMRDYLGVFFGFPFIAFFVLVFFGIPLGIENDSPSFGLYIDMLEKKEDFRLNDLGMRLVRASQPARFHEAMC